MTSFVTESALEEIVLASLGEIGFATLAGPDIAPEEPNAERSSYDQVVLLGRLKESLRRLNPKVPAEAIDEAVRLVTRTESPSLVENNKRFHQFLIDGVPVAYPGKEGQVVHDSLRLIDFDDAGRNDFLAVNQFTVIENKHNRRADVVVFINGLPLAVIELKNPADEEATVDRAFQQLQTYKFQIPSLFTCNELLVASDGLEARIGTLTADWERFMPWRTIDGRDIAPKASPQLDVLLRGAFDRRRLLDLVRYFVVFEDDGRGVIKKIAGYHQYHAVNKAVECTVTAASPDGDRRIGVVWHTQGSGKSLSMVFYAGKIIQHPAMENPTVVVITDRNDLDDQLFQTFANCQSLLRQTPERAESRQHLRQLLARASGGVIFTTIQKFSPDERGDTHPVLSDRRNIVVIADEAHRSQYGFRPKFDREKGVTTYGFAQHVRDALKNASFIAFTGTPIDSDDKSTKRVFGDYIDIYDIQRAVDDKATVPIYYEGRLAKIKLREEMRPKIDPDFEEVTEDQEEENREKLKSKWARLEAMVGADDRIKLIAEDLVNHFEERDAAMAGKAMIVCMSRRICVELHNAIVKLRPQWHDPDDAKGAIKIVMTGSASDKLEWQPHIRNKAGRRALADRFKDPQDSLKLVIVRDMWLTGFDVPCLHTMYIDKPMAGHGLMQAIARVNRVFKDKPGGRVVDYLGLADSLKRALRNYTDSGGEGDGAVDEEQAIALLKEKYEVVRAMFHGFDYQAILGGPIAGRISGLAAAVDFLSQLLPNETGDERRKRYLKAVTELSAAFALATPCDEATAIREEVGFFQAVRVGLVKATASESGKTQHELDLAVRQIVSNAVAAEGVIDIFRAAGLKEPDISILSDEFLEEVRRLPHRNLALELLRKLLNDEIKVRGQRNVVQARSFSQMLEETIKRYQNRSIETAQVIAELIDMAKDLRESDKRGEQLGLSIEEVAFYDALEVNDSAVKVLGDETLRMIAQELVDAVKRNVRIDWTVKESVRAKMRSLVRRILRKYGYPPDKQEKATQTVLEQAEVLCRDLAA